MIEQVKTCTKCKTSKHPDGFYSNKTGRGGKAAACKECTKADAAVWYQANRERAAASLTNWRLLNRGRDNANARRRYHADLERNRESKRMAARKKYKANPKKERIYRQRWASDNPARRLLTCVKSRSKSRGIAFNLTLADVAIPSNCPICGCMLSPVLEGKGFPQKTAPSIDRIVPQVGYVRGNISVICHDCNRQKNNLTLEKLERIKRYLLEHLGRGAVSAA